MKMAFPFIISNGKDKKESQPLEGSCSGENRRKQFIKKKRRKKRRKRRRRNAEENKLNSA